MVVSVDKYVCVRACVRVCEVSASHSIARYFHTHSSTKLQGSTGSSLHSLHLILVCV